MLETWHDALRSAERAVLERTPDPELHDWLDRNIRQSKTNSDLAPDEVIYLATLLDYLSLGDLGQQLLGNDASPASRNVGALLAAAHGRYDEALDEFQDALLDPGAAALRSRILANLSATNLRAGDLETSERYRVLALSTASATDDPVLDIVLASIRAGIAQVSGDDASLREAADALAQATRRRVAQLDRGHPQGFIAVADLAMVELELARIDRSIEKLERVATTLEAARCGIAVTLGQHHPQTLVVSANLCSAELDIACMDGSADRISQAVELSRQTYSRMREVIGETHPQTLLMAANVAAGELEHARATDNEPAARRAVVALQTACDRLTQVLGDDHPTTVSVLVNLASARLDLARRGGTPDEIELAVTTLYSASDRVGRTVSEDHATSALIQRELKAGQALMHGAEARTDTGDSADDRTGTDVAVVIRAPAISDPSLNVRYLSFYDAASRVADSMQQPAVAGPDQSFPEGTFLAELGAARTAELATVGRSCTFAPGEVVFRQGEPAGQVIVITQGRARITVASGGAIRVIAEHGPGDLIGEGAVSLAPARSASATAVTQLHGIRIDADVFSDFLDRNPEAMAVLESQLYGRMTTADSRAGLGGQNCTIMFIDIAQFSAADRTDGDRLAIVKASYRMLNDAVAKAGIDWNICHTEDRGDGALVIIPGHVPAVDVVHRLMNRLAANLLRHNRRALTGRRFSLRVAIDIGPVSAHEHGVSGETVISAARLVEATRLKAAVLEPDVVIGLAISPFVFARVIRHMPGAEAYEEIKFKVKEWKGSAWIRLYRD